MVVAVCECRWMYVWAGGYGCVGMGGWVYLGGLMWAFGCGLVAVSKCGCTCSFGICVVIIAVGGRSW